MFVKIYLFRQIKLNKWKTRQKENISLMMADYGAKNQRKLTSIKISQRTKVVLTQNVESQLKKCNIKSVTLL
jgi:hypothetical protein